MTELLHRCMNGDEAAIGLLVRRYRARALDLATALLGDNHLAEDAVQEAFLVVLERLGDLRDPQAFVGWFRQVVRTQCSRIVRRRKETLGADPVELHAPDPSAREVAETAERHRLVRKALSELPPAGRETAEMFYLQELRCADIARRLDIPTNTVKRRLHDARERLRHTLLGTIPDALPRPAPSASTPEHTGIPF